MSDDERYPIDAPGWAAIDRLLAARFPGAVPHQFASRRPYDLEGSTPLPAISVWEGTGPDHWLYVTYGLSELFEKSSGDPETSGFGFELTLRLPRAEGEVQPPAWALALLHATAGYVLSGDGALDSGDLVDLGAPIPLGDPIAILRGFVCIPDPVLGKIATVHGSLLFLALYGLTADELAAMEGWSLERKVGLVREVSPLVVTDPARAPLTDDPATAPVMRRYALNVMV